MLISVCKAGVIFPEEGMVLNSIHNHFMWEQFPGAMFYKISLFDEDQNIIFERLEETTSQMINEELNWATSYYYSVDYALSNTDTIFSDYIGLTFFSIGEQKLLDFEIGVNNDQLTQDGLIIYSQYTPTLLTGVINENGQEILNIEGKFINSISEFGEIFGLVGQEKAGQFNFSNQIIWETDETYQLDEHEIIKLPNQNFLGFVPVYQLGPIPLGNWTTFYQNLGYLADGSTNEFMYQALKIIEFDFVNKQEVWSWNQFDHFSMDYFCNLNSYWNYAYVNGLFDWIHSNSFHFNKQDSTIYVSNRHFSSITKLKYPSGEIIWDMGLPPQYGTGENNICDELLFSYQHHIQIIENGDLLFFDNGNLSDTLLLDELPTSRIRRIQVNQDLSCETVWEYTLDENLHGNATGSVQLLENGNYFIYTQGSGSNNNGIGCTLLEVSHNKEIVWKGTVNDGNEIATFYRAFKIPSINPDAFSVSFHNYGLYNLSDSITNGIYLSDQSDISFTIFNKSKFNQLYHINLFDEQGCFGDINDTIFVESESQLDLFYHANFNNFHTLLINASIKPVSHPYAKQDYDLYVINENFVSIEKSLDFAKNFNFNEPFPNPFNSKVKLSFSLSKDSQIKLSIFNLKGNRIKLLVNEKLNNGIHKFNWDGKNDNGDLVASGMYFINLTSKSFSESRKLIFLK